ncbi:hypothetical protein CSUI_009355 [Cystoisospora suis]|uniref:Transmembrane protein n=1 Tax=Cystoisospora suis TaxID=483139 RepID=A0A2C6KK28_9APIC|nr:hypothetical protein CSUI_009355 [Cystoisospora suis]
MTGAGRRRVSENVARIVAAVFCVADLFLLKPTSFLSHGLCPFLNFSHPKYCALVIAPPALFISFARADYGCGESRGGSAKSRFFLFLRAHATCFCGFLLLLFSPDCHRVLFSLPALSVYVSGFLALSCPLFAFFPFSLSLQK